MYTTNTAIYAIACAHKKVDKSSPTEQNLVKQIVDASKLIAELKPVNRKQTLQTAHLKAIIAKFRCQNLEELQIATSITFGFNAFLRWNARVNWRNKTL